MYTFVFMCTDNWLFMLCLWDGCYVYGMVVMFMGWLLCLWDGVMFMGWLLCLWDGCYALVVAVKKEKSEGTKCWSHIMI